MPDTRTGRGPHPKDSSELGRRALPALTAAADDLAWLLSRGYSRKAALVLVGDRHALTARQRTALERVVAADADLEGRRSREAAPEELAGRDLWIDGYNVLLTVEVALGGGAVIAARDGTFRDMASMSGHYRRVRQTDPALHAIGAFLASFGPREVRWLLDRPISNSGRLKARMEEVAAAAGWPWTIELSASPDRELIEVREALVATADSAILDRAPRWLNLARRVVESAVPEAWVVAI
jgi:hypothetical protein